MTDAISESLPLQDQLRDNTGARSSGKLADPPTRPVLKASFWRKWSAAVVSVLGLVASCALAVSHHVYYSTLDRTAVGNTERQQWALRIGTFFAVAFATSLRLSITSAYFQYVWLKLKGRSVSLAGIDDAFDALGDIWSLFSPRLITKLPLAVVIGLVFWSMNVVTLFPPATLSTIEAEAAGSISILRPSLMYIDPSDTSSTPYVDLSSVSSTVLKTAFNQVSEDGKTTPPTLLEDALDYSYESSVHLPHVSCNQISTDAALDFRPEIEEVIDIILTRGALAEVDIEIVNVTVDDDFRFTYQKRFWEGTDVVNTSELLAGRLHYIAWASTVYPEDEDWSMSDSFLLRGLVDSPDESIMFDGSLSIAWANLDGPGVNISRCELHNSSWDVSVEVKRGDVYLFHKEMLEQGYPLSSNKTLWEVDQQGPSSLALALKAWMHPLYSEIQGCAIYLRELAGVWESWKEVPTFLSDSLEYQQYREYTKGKVLTQISNTSSYNRRIESLSQEYSFSLMSLPDLCEEVKVETDNSKTRIIYQYKAKNLLVAYSAALLAALAVVATGLWSFCLNGAVSYNRKVSTIAASMQSPEMPDVLKYAPVGTDSIDSRVVKERLRLQLYDIDGSDEIENGRLRAYRFVRCKG